MSDHGVTVNKYVYIDYGENTDNYYSVDNGNTWLKYNDEIKIKESRNLKAKSLIQGKITKEAEKYIQINLENDTMGTRAYNGNESDGEEVPFREIRYIEVSPEVIGDKIQLKAWIHGTTRVDLVYADENKEEQSSINLHWESNLNSETIDRKFDIPEGTKYIGLRYTTGYNGANWGNSIFYEIYFINN